MAGGSRAGAEPEHYTADKAARAVTAPVPQRPVPGNTALPAHAAPRAGRSYRPLRHSCDAHAQVSKCNCDKVVSGCSASISFDKEKSLATVNASADQCARVTFGVDNTPYTSVFNGGKTVENIMIFDKRKKISISVR